MTPRLYEMIAPLATVASLTALALLPPLIAHVVELDAKIIEQHEVVLWHEEFLVHCLSGRTMVVGRTNAVMCIKL